MIILDFGNLERRKRNKQKRSDVQYTKNQDGDVGPAFRHTDQHGNRVNYSIELRITTG